ncbi:MAG: 3-hydroxyacyl-CoA dehydrogenase NAD-binding domain-containing protein [Gammaproteobacteria bacterium]|nr:3-hydroxyacyl-CoA dehydrogenase NAD-binding domain-containing protein [Gammaproteobacteria bacterium]
MKEIKKAAVIGAGTMGSGIASHLANAGVPVVLLDIVPDGANNRNVVAEGAVQRLSKSQPPALMQRSNAELITPGNIDDHLELIADADWIAEAVVERLDVKHALYKKIDVARRTDSMVSSNTSTIPLSLLTEGMSKALRESFCITHFFNPVRYMRLLEIVAGPSTRPEIIDALSRFCDLRLGKGVVPCRDTPGFLANRVGVYALQVGMVEAAKAGLTVEEADALMGRPMGIPKTGVFGLYDLIGLDLMEDVASSLESALPEGDAFHEVAAGIPLISTMIGQGYNGNKGKGGFYRQRDTGGERVREAIDLNSGQYRLSERSILDAALAAERSGLRALVTHDDKFGHFAWRVLAKILSYAASLIPEVADDPLPVDEAMKLGYSWAKGPFEMIDDLGPAWFRQKILAEGIAVPEALKRVGEGSFYRADNARLERFTYSGKYAAVTRAPGVMRLGDISRAQSPVASNSAASLWDVGDGVACVEFHTKANALSPESMALVAESLEIVEEEFKALLFYNDAPHFSVGFNLEFALTAAKEKAWARLDGALDAFQSACLACRYAPFPVVAAPAGMSLGGGFEVLLHCDALQAHANSNMGLVETLVGLVPSGGGCKQLLHRWTRDANNMDELLQGALETFAIIGMGKTASSPLEAMPLRLFEQRDRFSMNRDRLLAEAKSRALELAGDYSPPQRPEFTALGRKGLEAMYRMLDDLDGKGITTPHDRVVGRHLARVLCGGERDAGASLSEDDVLALEREAFIALCDTEETVARIEHMLSTGRPLRN